MGGMETLPRVIRRMAGDEGGWWERRRRLAYGVRSGRWCWSWRADGQRHYRQLDSYPRRSELAAGLTRWSEVWRAQEHIIDTLEHPDNTRMFQDALSWAIARVDVAADMYAIPHLAVRAPARLAASSALLAALLGLEERSRIPGFRLWGERWACIDWPEWHADFAAKLYRPAQLKRHRS